MATTNSSGQFTADIEAFIAKETLPLARRQLVAYQFGDPERLPQGRGTTFTATRYNRVALPFQPLSEGVPPVGETMTIGQVTVTLQQWGDRITVTDVAELTIKHPIMNEAKKLVALQTAETLERNTFNTLAGFTQVNYVNSRGARGSLVAGDVLNTYEINRSYSQLVTLGAPRYMGDEMTNTKLEADAGGARASNNPRGMPHYVAIVHPFVEGDLTQNSTFVLASSYSDVNKLYNYEVGQWHCIRFCSTNMVPSWTGVANLGAVGTAYTAGTAGSLATNSYYVIITASDTQNQYESRIYAVSGAVSVTGATGSISVVLPTLAGFTFNAYIGTTTSPANLATSVAGPTSGPLTGQAVQMSGGQTVILTGIGTAQTPPAAPAAGVTVYPTYVFGRGAYGQVVLDDIKITWLAGADKSDPLNQLRVVGWKVFYGTLIKNNQFAMRIESASAFNSTFG